MWVMTNYKVRAAGNDNVVLFQIRGFPADSFAAGLDILEKNICCWGQLLGRRYFLNSELRYSHFVFVPPQACIARSWHEIFMRFTV